MEKTQQKPCQSNQTKQNQLVQIESKGIVNIIAKIPEIFEISEMLASQPIFSGQDEIDDQCQGKNPRKLCQNSHQYPFTAIGLLFVQFSSTYKGYGTGFLIADNVAFTAAHNVYCRQGNLSARYASLIMETHQYPGRKFAIVCAYVPKEYKHGKLQEEIRNNDFAILILGGGQELMKRKYGKIQLSSDVEKKDRINVYGYPNKYSKEQSQEIKKIQNKKPQEKYLFGSQDEVVDLDKARIFYKATTSKGVSGSPVLRLNQNSFEYQAVAIHTHGHKIQNSGVRTTNEVLIRINQWIKAFYQGKESDERIMLIDKGCYQIVLAKPIQRPINKGIISITPDTTTYAWKQNKYRQDNANKNVCIYQGRWTQSNWLCSVQDLCDGECVLITIKVHKVDTYYDDYYKRQFSFIALGLMDSNYKGKQKNDTLNHCVYLDIASQYIWRPNQEQTQYELIGCSCQSSLSSVPRLIECHVNRNQNTITWHYNGKHQANSTIPNSWKDGRKLCAVVCLWSQGDSVEFM